MMERQALAAAAAHYPYLQGLWAMPFGIGTAVAGAPLIYYAVLVGLRTHGLVIWGLVFVAALLPVWGRLGADRDAVAMFPLAAALIASGLFDQRRLARSFRSPHLEDSSLADSSLGG